MAHGKEGSEQIIFRLIVRNLQNEKEHAVKMLLFSREAYPVVCF